MSQQLSTTSLRWITGAVLTSIKEGPAAEAPTGAAALHQLLIGTPAEPHTHQLLHHLTNARHATHNILTALDADPPAFS